MAETGGGLNGQQAVTSETATIRLIDAPEPEPIDLLEHAGSPMLKRVLPLLGVTLVAFMCGGSCAAGGDGDAGRRDESPHSWVGPTGRLRGRPAHRRR